MRKVHFVISIAASAFGRESRAYHPTNLRVDSCPQEPINACLPRLDAFDRVVSGLRFAAVYIGGNPFAELSTVSRAQSSLRLLLLNFSRYPRSVSSTESTRGRAMEVESPAHDVACALRRRRGASTGATSQQSDYRQRAPTPATTPPATQTPATHFSKLLVRAARASWNRSRAEGSDRAWATRSCRRRRSSAFWASSRPSTRFTKGRFLR